MAPLEGKQFGKYVLLEKLAVGGMAEIYKAKTYGAEGFEKLLAIKRILPHAAEDLDFINMLIDEAKLSVVLSHANIVQVFDLGKVDNDYFISMEFIHGVNLRDILYRLREKSKKLSTELACYLASEVCKGLDYAHRKTDSNNQPLGIVHRDISPQNILISYEGEVKIVDFGIAKAAMNISHTMAGILKGKIAYMSPEQALGKTIDSRTDLFSLGIVLYECLTGQKLYTGESQFEVLKKIRTMRIDVAKLPPTVPAPLKTILAKALAYNVEERYLNAGDMQIALTKYLYATYTDFSPRKMAAFVKELFAEELQKEKRTKEEMEREGGTGSISLVTGRVQEMIVHRETESGKEGKVDITRPVAPAKSETLSQTLAASTGLQKLVLGGLMVSLLVAGGGWAVWKKVFSTRVPAAAATGTLHLATTPPGADIYLNGEATGIKTPAILENLKIDQNYLVGLALEKFGRTEKNVRLTSTEPHFLDLPLSKNTGVLNIISEPPGAAILVNGIVTGKITPATLEDLSLNQEYRITLSKPSYSDFEQPIALASEEPQKLMAALTPVSVEKKGTLLIETEPADAKIYLNEQDTGKVTPATLKNLEVGEVYALSLRKDDFEILKKEIRLLDEEPVSVLEKLTAIKKIEPPPSPPPPPGEKERAVKEPPKREPVVPKVEEKPKPATPSGFGNIQVASKPSGAEIFINGELKGTTPASLKVAAGSVKVSVMKGEETLPCRRTFQIRPGESVSLDCTLETMFGKISINSDPPRADVYFNGKKMEGRTPMVIKKVKRDKDHSLRIELKGYRSWSKSFNLKDGDEKSFNVELEKS